MVTGQGDQVHREFEMLARRVLYYVEASIRIHELRPVPGCLEDREAAAHPDWPVREAWTTPHLLLSSCEEHLRLVAAAATAPRVALGVVTAGRTAHEAAARALWLLEPGTDVGTRCARYYSMRLSGLFRHAEVGRRLGRDAHADALQQLRRVKREASARGFRVGKIGAHTAVDDQVLPTATELAGLGLDEATEWGQVLYDRASAVAHGSMAGLLSMADDADSAPDEQGMVMLRFRLGAVDVALSAAAAVLTHQAACQRLAAGLGHELDPRWHSCLGQLMLRVRAHLGAAASESAET